MKGYMKNTPASEHEKNFEESAPDWMEDIVKEAEKRDKEVGEITPQCNLDDNEDCLYCGS